MRRWIQLLRLPVVMLGLAGFLGWSGVALLTRSSPRASELLAWLLLVAATVLAAFAINVGRQQVLFGSGTFRMRRFGSFIERKGDFTVQVTVDGFPGMRIRYNEGPRTMDVFAEAMAKTSNLVLDRSSMAYWNPPYTREGMDNATRQTVLDRIMAALSFSGYVIELQGGFPQPGDQLRQRIQVERAVAEATRRHKAGPTKFASRIWARPGSPAKYVTSGSRQWMETDRTGGPIDEVFDGLRAEFPNLVIERLVMPYPADDANVYWLTIGPQPPGPRSRESVQVDTGENGNIPFFLEGERDSGELVETDDPKAARSLLAQWLRRRPTPL
jgi:hypothetical protein